MSQENLERALQLLGNLQNQPGDVSALKALEAALQSAIQRGEGQDSEELRQSLQDMKVKQSEFVSVMVHEIRKPMTSIRGYSDMLAKNVMGELNDMQAQFVHTIRNNVISMDYLVSDISDISKLQSGRMLASPKMEMYKNIAMQLEKDLTEMAEARRVKLVFDTPQGLPLLNLDSKLAEKALRKLIENSIKYTLEGEGEVTVTAEGVNDKLHITVKDNGVGISENDQKRLGELFFRGDQELVTATKGYGMGLAIVIECLKLLEGELRWQSKEGEGSTFEIYLPAMS